MDLANKYSCIFTSDFVVHHASEALESTGDIWWFNDIERTLFHNGVNIPLTRTECTIVGLLAFSHERVVSKEAIIIGLGKDPDSYNGLEMSLSRLQGKFAQGSSGKRLLRSVRNRGYCLTQVVRSAYC